MTANMNEPEVNPEEFRSVIDHHFRVAIDLMKATGEGADPAIWYELKLFMPQERPISPKPA